MNNFFGLPQMSKETYSISSANGVGNMPSNTEYFSKQKHGGGKKIYHHLGGRDRYVVKPWDIDPAARSHLYQEAIAPLRSVVYANPVKTCGGTNCNTFYNSNSKQFESAKGSQCTCCSKGKYCRTNYNVTDNSGSIKYNYCCPGTECKNGTCQ